MGQNNWNSPDFWSYLTIRVLLDILRASSLMLFEGAVVSIIKQQGGDYGLQKLFGTLGAVIFGPLSGILIDFGHAYTGVIVLYALVRTMTAACILKLDLDFKVKRCFKLRSVNKLAGRRSAKQEELSTWRTLIVALVTLKYGPAKCKCFTILVIGCCPYAKRTGLAISLW